MSIMGYLIPGTTDTRVRKVEIDKNIRVEGAVLEGRTPLDVALTAGTTPQQPYSRVAEYDAVLRAHCSRK